MIIIPAVVAIVIPLGFLYLVRWLDLYASGSFKTVLICFAWGWVAFFLALKTNNAVLTNTDIEFITVLTLVAPIIEEIFKSLSLVYFVQRPEFTYFVDGAIYGFAAGTGFSVIENLFYLQNSGGKDGLLLALSRVFSTSLMHGSASALVGITLGRLKFGRGHSRLLSVLLGWASAIILHLTFNNIVNMQAGITTLVLLVVIGLGSLGVVAAFIFWGLAEERRWLHDTLRANVGVSREESSVVQKMADLNVLLAPIGDRFGPEKRKQVEHLIHLEAQLGLKVKTHSLTPDPKLRETLVTQIAAMEQQASQMQRAIGLSCMTLVRMLITKDVVSMLSRLQSLEAKETMSQGSIWAIHTTKPS